jgi:hypothetical protein
MNLGVLYNPLVRLAEDIAKTFRPIDDKEKARNIYKVLVLHFFNKSWRTFESIHLLCANGLGQEASILLRSFLEVVVNARYISKAPSSRAVLFEEYGYVEKMNFRRALIEYQKANPKDEWINRIVRSGSTDQSEILGVENQSKKWQSNRECISTIFYTRCSAMWRTRVRWELLVTSTSRVGR